MKLSHTEKDVLSEFITIGYPDVRTDLSELLQTNIEIELPRWETYTEKDHQICGLPRKAVIVEQSFAGQYSGKGVLIINKEHAIELCKLIMDSEDDGKSFNATQKDIVKEITNIIINRIVCSMDNFVGDQHDFLVPYCVLGKPVDILTSYKYKEGSFPVFAMRSAIRVEGKEFEVIIGLLIAQKELNTLLGLLKAQYPQYRTA